jgi:acyl-CoA reductase-like NAD-dependent aldehyde dehydrogenase
MQSSPVELDRRVSPSTTIPCINPANRERLGDVPICSPESVRDRVAKARLAQKAWATTSFAERRRVLSHILDHVLQHADELCDIISRDSGKTLNNAMLGEIWPVCEKIRHTMSRGESALTSETVSAGLLPHKKAVIEYIPLGVIGVIAPWNYPLQNILGPAIPALFAGNAVIVKVSEQVAWSGDRFQRIFDEALTKAGFSTDLVQVIHGYAETGKALISSGVDKIIFTGSMENGRRVIEESAKNLTPVILELGGKDAFIVCDDANLEQAAHAAMAGVFIACGQNCLAAERFFVFDAVYDEFVARVTELTTPLRQGDPRAGKTIDMGAMVTEPQLDIVERLVRDAVERGAKVITGGRRVRDGEGNYFAPTILVDVPEGAKILTEETFGPVMVIARVQNEDEAIARTNDSQYGLSATVMTRDGERARRMAKAIVAGGTSINDFGFTYMAMDLPFGGVRGSGFGRLNGREGLRACCNQKAVIYDRLPLGAPAKLYPVGPFDYDMARGTIRTIYGRGLAGKLTGLRDLARAAWSKLSSS